MPEPSEHVLVVDDDEAFGELISELLGERGHQVERHTDPLEAAERLAQVGFAAAVVDLVMPVMGGLELTDRIHQASPDTQVLILTGQGDLDSALESIHRGVFDYLRKDATQITSLVRAVGRALERWRLLRENRELLGRLEQSNRRLRALQETGVALSAETHLDTLLDHVVAAARELCCAATARVMLLRRTPEDVFVVRESVGNGADALRGVRLQPGEGVGLLALEHGEALVLPSVRDHPRYSRRCDEMPTDQPGFGCAPLSHGQVRGVLMVAGSAAGGFQPEDRESLASLGRQAAVAVENAENAERALNFFTHTSEILVSVLDVLDIFYRGHSRRVAALADMVTRRLGLGDAERRNVHFAALLHDIGKIRLESGLLSTTGFESEAARDMLRRHPALGVELLRPITALEGILPLIHGHHERWDGAGYPLGLAGEDIPLGARIIAVADAFDAMTCDTPHGARRGLEEALAELEACAGSQFDPLIARLFIEEYRQHGDELRL